MQDTMGSNAAFLLFWGILNSYFPLDCCQTDSTFTASFSPNLSMNIPQGTAAQTMETLTNGISSSGSAKSTSLDKSTTSGTPTLSPSHANNDSINTTVSNAQDGRDQTSHSNISSSWTNGTLNDTQKLEPATKTSTNREQTTFSESSITTISPTTTPDSSSSIFTTSSEPNHLTMRSTTESYSTIQATTQAMNTSDSPSIYQSTNELVATSSNHLQVSQAATAAAALLQPTSPQNTPTNANIAQPSVTTSISSSRSVTDQTAFSESTKTTSLDTTTISESATLTLSQEDEDESTTSTDANTQDDQTSHSNIPNSWTTGTLTGKQKPEPTTETSTNREQTTFSESSITTISPTTTPDSSSSIFTTSSEPNHLTIRSTTETYSTIQATTQPMNTSVSPINYQSTAPQTMETLTNATSRGITTTGSSFPSPDASSGTSHSAATTSQQLESSDHTQVFITSNESTTTMVGLTTTPDLSSDVFTSSEPNDFTTRSTTESYPAIQASTQGTVSRQAMTPDSKPTSMNTPSMFLTTQENQKTNTNASLNPFSPVSPLTVISNDSEPVTTPLAEEHKGSTVSISIQTALNRSDSEGTTITDTWSNSITSIPAVLTNSPLSSNTSRDGNADDSAYSVKSTIVFVFNIPKVPVFKTITFNHPRVNQVTVMNTVLRP